MDDEQLTSLTNQIKRQFGRYLRRSGYGGETLSIRLPTLLNEWVALPAWRQQFRIDDLLPHEWVEIHGIIVDEYRNRWQHNAQETKTAQKKYAALAEEKGKQGTFDFN